MKAFGSLIAVVSLIGAVVLVPVYGAVLFSIFLFGAFLLALVGIIGGVEHRTVQQHDPSMDPEGWRR